MRQQINMVLAALLVCCGLGLVTAQHRARGLFIDLERAQEQARKLEIEWNQLLLEQTSYSRHSLIENSAKRDLQMQTATPARTEYLTPPAPRGTVPGPGGGGP